MNKRQKENQKRFLKKEQQELKRLTKVYRTALDDIEEKIKILSADELTQSKIYQIEYQKQLKEQVELALDKLHTQNYEEISKYLNGVYEDSFIGTVYDLHGQGIPLTLPINPADVQRAIVMDSKISEGLYKKLGINTKMLKGRISSEITRGLATGESWRIIAERLSLASMVDYNRTKRIVRTEGHRIQCQSAMDSMIQAKKRGADIVKQWDATLDGATRPHHMQLDGQIRELDEPFKVGKYKVMMPNDFGDPAEDCNCRCAVLQRAKWGLTDKELETLKQRAEFFGLDKTDDFNDFKKKYLKAVKDDDNLITPLVSSEDEAYNDIIKELNKSNIEYNPVMKHDKPITPEEIIKAIGGGDRTSGSCASLSLAYVGQKQGWNVLDYRGGDSRLYFATTLNLSTLSNAEGMVTHHAKGKSDLTVGNRLLKEVKIGKEYLLVVGRHASIVRRIPDGKSGKLQYLELQSATKLGWNDFNGNARYTLSNRFGCTTTSTSEFVNSLRNFMIDIDDSNFDTDEFKTILGYLNTNKKSQLKGDDGFEK